MKKIIAISAIAAAASLLTGNVMAEDAPAAAPDPGPVTANVTLASQYRYRGISQTNSLPAIQGGFDYAHESGFYIGNWNSSISWINDGYSAPLAPATNAPSAPIEMDFYGGYKTEVSEGLMLDIGLLEYYYPTKNLPNYSAPSATAGSLSSRNTAGASPSTLEGYISATYGIAMVKYSYALTNLFGIDNSKGSQYFDLSLNYDTGWEGVILNGHVGYQYVSNTMANDPNFSYTDWKLGATKDFGHGLSLAGAYIGTNANGFAYYAPTSTPTNIDNTGKGTFVVSLTKTF